VNECSTWAIFAGLYAFTIKKVILLFFYKNYKNRLLLARVTVMYGLQCFCGPQCNHWCLPPVYFRSSV